MNSKIVRETIAFKIDKEKFEFTLFHNINFEKYRWDLILQNWMKEMPEHHPVYTVETLCAYINSKSHLTDAKAFTEEQFEQLRNKI